MALDYYLRVIKENIQTQETISFKMIRVSGDQFLDLLEERDENLKTLKYRRTSFIFEKDMYSIDSFSGHQDNLRILNRKKGKDDCHSDVDHLPDFLRQVVTD